MAKMHPFDRLAHVEDTDWEGTFTTDVFLDCLCKLDAWTAPDGKLFGRAPFKCRPRKTKSLRVITEDANTPPSALQRKTFDNAIAALPKTHKKLTSLFVQEARDFFESCDVRKGLDAISTDLVPDLIDFLGLTIFAQSKNQKHFYSLSFNCGWDSEHGIEVLMRGSSIVEVGGIGDVYPPREPGPFEMTEEDLRQTRLPIDADQPVIDRLMDFIGAMHEWEKAFIESEDMEQAQRGIAAIYAEYCVQNRPPQFPTRPSSIRYDASKTEVRRVQSYGKKKLRI
ncbi:MAG: hypothetical protein GC159_02545 [Phycisphaera sp.]|nr:hypothetical protein [Phycisphaera sp.]